MAVLSEREPAAKAARFAANDLGHAFQDRL
jgi:hypothetical protein